MQFPSSLSTKFGIVFFFSCVCSMLRSCPVFLGRERPPRRLLPEVIICSSHHHHAVIGSYFLPEIFHCFHVALQGILTDHKEDRGLHLQEGVVNVLQERGENVIPKDQKRESTVPRRQAALHAQSQYIPTAS